MPTIDPKRADLPAALRLWAWFGAPVPDRPNSSQAVGDCPFCGKAGKLYVSRERGTWDCKSCMLEGGPDVGERGLLARLYGLCGEPGEPECARLAASRRLLNGSTVRAWGLRVSPLTGEWLVPGYDRHGRLVNLYRWVRRPSPGGGPPKFAALAAPGLSHGLFGPWAAAGAGAVDPRKPDAWVLEGPWDGMAFWEAVSLAKRVSSDPPEYARTGNPELSPLRETNVYAAPGVNVFPADWAYLFAGKRLTFGYDNDFPRQDAGGREVGLQGFRGTAAAVGVLAGAAEKPGEVRYLRWGPDGHDPALPNGYDVRDALAAGDGLAGTRVAGLSALLGKTAPIPPEWVAAGGRGVEPGKVEAGPVPCDSWRELRTAWVKAMKWNEGLEAALCCMLACCASVEVGGDQLWLRVVSPPSGGKTSLCDGVATAKEFVDLRSNFTGFLSGWKEDRAGSQDFSLLAKLRNKTMVTKDGDTLLQQPNLPQILAQARDIYDRNTTASYGNAVDRRYENLNMTWVLCGTASLRALDTSELGERFLTVSMMDGVDDEWEDEIADRKLAQLESLYATSPIANGRGPDTPEQGYAKRLTGGYVAFLRRTVGSAVARLSLDAAARRRLKAYAKFVALLRARESVKQQEEVSREMSTRLLSQMFKLAYCLAVVRQRPAVDADVLRLVRKAALDSARGVTFDLCRFLYDDGLEAAARGDDDPGVDPARLKVLAKFTTEKATAWVRFLGKIGVTESYSKPGTRRTTVRLTPAVRGLWREVVGDE